MISRLVLLKSDRDERDLPSLEKANGEHTSEMPEEMVESTMEDTVSEALNPMLPEVPGGTEELSEWHYPHRLITVLQNFVADYAQDEKEWADQNLYDELKDIQEDYGIDLGIETRAK